MSELQKKIRTYILQNVLFGQSAGLSDTDSFIESGLIDSTGVLELVSFLEEEFAIVVQEEEIAPENLDSIVRLAAFVTRKRAQLSAASSRSIVSPAP